MRTGTARSASRIRPGRGRPATRTAQRLAGALCVVFLVAACGGTPGADLDPAADPTFETGEPETERTTDPEPPVDTGDADPVAVELPGLPIGGNTLVVSDTLQCVDVGWTAPPDLPDWLGIAVTGVAFTPAEDFALSSEACPGEAASCLDPSFRLTLTGPRCVVAVTWTGPTLEDERLMSFSAGVLACPADRVPECESFRDQVATEGSQSIALDPAPTEFPADEQASEEPSESPAESPGESPTESPVESPAESASEASSEAPSSAPTTDEGG